MEDERIPPPPPKKFLMGNFITKRLVGKPRTRWEDVVRRDMSHILEIREWRRRAEDREEWRRLVTEDQDPEEAVSS